MGQRNNIRWDTAEGPSGATEYVRADTLRRWDTMPDVEGWYWFSGKYRQYGFEDGYWVETLRPQILSIVSDVTVDGFEVDGSNSVGRERQ